MTAPLYNGLVVILVLAVIAWIATYKDAGSNTKFPEWFARYLCDKNDGCAYDARDHKPDWKERKP